MDRTGLCLLTVHAHPDDEASKGAGTVSRYHAAGVRTVLVTCTGGEEGDILNPAMDRPEIKENIGAIRRAELAAAAAVIGYDEVVMLGYRDSGMPDSAANADPRCFAQAPLDEAVGRLVAVIRRERPQVIVTYPKDQKGYPHPDHLRVNEISEIAFDAAADPAAYPEAGAPWQAGRLLYTTWSMKRMFAMHEKFLELGLESPFTGERFERMIKAREEAAANPEPELPRIVVDVTGHTQAMRLGLLAHATQVDPNSRHWFGLPEDVADSVYPYEEYEVARDVTGAADGPEDIFSGVSPAAVS
jgi:mycothiol S-conjugate amidase